MQPCNRIYYSKVYWRLNMFQVAHHSSSGALNRTCSLWFIYIRGGRPLWRLRGKWIETCWAFNKLWNNTFYYKVTSYWLFLLIHNTMHGSINVKIWPLTLRCVIPLVFTDKLMSYLFSLKSHLYLDKVHRYYINTNYMFRPCRWPYAWPKHVVSVNIVPMYLI
jgi:hypothetical protein